MSRNLNKAAIGSGSNLRHPLFLRREQEGARMDNKFPVKESVDKARSKYLNTSFHEAFPIASPRLNTIVSLKKRLNQVKHYEAKILESEKELTATLNRAVTSRLNFPAHQAIFKDLPKIDETLVPETAENLIKNAVKRAKENKKDSKSKEVDENISDLIQKLVDLEYQNEDLNTKTLSSSLPSENELMGFNKFKQPNFHMPNSKSDATEYEMKVHLGLLRSHFGHENYLTYNNKFDPNAQSTSQEEGSKKCHCISSTDFYTRHSQCS